MRSSDAATGIASPTRLLPLQGGRNFRDLGGYQTGDGRSVRWGRLYRSGSMAALTVADCELLSGFGIRLVCDLRTTSERETAPSSWQSAGAPRYWGRDYTMSFGDLRALAANGPPSAAQLREIMHTVYRELPFEQAPAYREMFNQLAAGELPMVINCTAGKDRTGVATALVLTALGVPRDVIVEDYALTNECLAGQRFSENARGMLSQMPEDAVRAIMGSDPDYLASAFAAMEQRHGSIEQYLSDMLGAGPDALLAIRAALLE